MSLVLLYLVLYFFNIGNKWRLNFKSEIPWIDKGSYTSGHFIWNLCNDFYDMTLAIE